MLCQLPISIFGKRKMGESVFKILKFPGFGFFNQMLILFFLWAKCSKSFRLIGYCFLLFLDVMIRKCLHMLSCTNPIQESSAPDYLWEDKKILCNSSLPACLGFFNMMRCQWTCSKQLRKKKTSQRSIFSNTVSTALHWRVRLFSNASAKQSIFEQLFSPSVWVLLFLFWFRSFIQFFGIHSARQRLGWPNVFQKTAGEGFWGKLKCGHILFVYFFGGTTVDGAQ